MLIIGPIVMNEMIPTTLISLWGAGLLLAIVWLLVRRWRWLHVEELHDTAVSPPSLAPFSAQVHGQIIATLLVGGLLLLMLGQLSYVHLTPTASIAVLAMMGLGLGLFLWAGSRIRSEGLADDWLARWLHRVGVGFGVAGWQAGLLGFAGLLALLAHLAAGDQLLARRWDVSVVAWLLALGFCLVGGVSMAEWHTWLRRGLGIAPWEWWLVAGLFVGAWLLRGTAVAEFPNTFSGDEGAAGLHASLFLQGQANNWFTVGWFSFPSLYYALQSVFLELFGQTIEALRYFAALGGALAVVATYFWARVLFDRGTAVAAAVVLMGSHYHIHMSRIGLNNVWDSLFVALVLAALWYGWQSGRRLPFVLAGLALGLGQYFYVSVRVLPLLVLIWMGVMWWRQPIRWRQQKVNFACGGITAVFTVLPLGLYFVTHWAEFQAPFNRVTIVGERLASMAAAEGQSQTVIVLRQMWYAAQGFTHLPLRLLYEPGVPLLLPLAAALFLAGVAWGLLHLDGRYGLLLLPLLSVVLLSGFSQDPPASQRFILALPSVAIFVALPLGLFRRWLQPLWADGKVWLWMGTAVVLLWLVFVDITFYFDELYDAYVLGGHNTIVATDVASYLAAEPDPPIVYFFGFPRMGYFSLATIPYLAPEAKAVDLIEPLVGPPDWAITEPTLFVFLPERRDELSFVQEAYPSGTTEEVQDAQNQLLYLVYRVYP